MSAEKAIFGLLSADTDVTALVPTTRIYPAGKRVQRSGIPAISYFRVDADRVYSMTGPSGYAMARMQIDIWGSDWYEARNIADKVRLALSGYRGTINGVNVQALLLLDDHDVVDDEEEILVVDQAHIAMDFRVHYVEIEKVRAE